MSSIFVLLILFQIKHFLADYPLQGKFMLGKFKETGWILPLSVHCLVHMGFTFLISLCFSKSLSISVGVSILDFILHFTMDRIKASSKLLGRFEAISKDQFKGLTESRALAVSGLSFSLLQEESKRIVTKIDSQFKSNTYFWWALGLDQAVHHLTHYLIIYLLVTL